MMYTAVILLIFIFDFFQKKHMDKTFMGKQQRPEAGGKIILKKYYNTGTAGDFLSGHPKAALCLHSIVFGMALAGLLYTFLKKGPKALKTGFAFLIGGGLSNLYDRLEKGYVVDYFSFGFGPGRFQRMVFNVSDFFIFLGIILLMIEAFRKEGSI